MTRDLIIGGHTDGVRLTPEERATGVHVIGAPGSGKSKLLEHLARQVVDAGQGLILFDPHGPLYEGVLAYCTARRPRRPVYCLNPSDGALVFGFNPFTAGEGDPSTVVERAIQATVKAWGHSNTDQTPRLERWLRCVYHVLIEKGLSLAEAELLLDYTAPSRRAYLTTGTTVAAEWRQLATLKSAAQFDEQVESTRNRLMRFYAARSVRRFLALTDRSVTLDLQHAMDTASIILVKLQPSATLSPMNGRLVGTLLLTSIFETARRRPRPLGRDPELFTVICDEVQNYLLPDIAEILAQARKMGIGFIGAHQFLEQVRAEDPRLVAALHGAARTKIVFSVGSNADAAELVHELYPGQIDMNEVKRTDHELRFRPVAVRGKSHTKSRGGGSSTAHATSTAQAKSRGRGQHGSRSITAVLARSRGTSDGHTNATGTTTGSSSGSSFGSGSGTSSPLYGALYGFGTHSDSDFYSSSDGYSKGESEISADTSSTSEAKSEAEAWSQQMGESEVESETDLHGQTVTRGRNDNWAESESDVPVTEHVPYLEPSYTLHSLDEQRQRAADRLRALPQRHCVVRTPDGRAHDALVPVVTSVPLPSRRVADYELECGRRAGALPPAEVDSLIDDRRLQIEQQAANFDQAEIADVHSLDALVSPTIPQYEPISLRPHTTHPPFSKPGRKPRQKPPLPRDPT